MLVSSGPHNDGIQVTNDGATILKSIGVDNPAAKVLVGEWACCEGVRAVSWWLV